MTVKISMFTAQRLESFSTFGYKSNSFLKVIALLLYSHQTTSRNTHVLRTTTELQLIFKKVQRHILTLLSYQMAKSQCVKYRSIDVKMGDLCLN